MGFNLFLSDSYVSVMKAKMAEDKRRWGKITQMAAAGQCQRSHLSRVLSEEVHLTLEQGDALCEFWQFSETESEYFLSLVEFARAGTKNLRLRMERKLKRIRKEQEDLAIRLNQATIGSEDKKIIYYSNWYWSALHILVSIPRYQTTESLAERISMPVEFTKYALENLEKFGLIRNEKGRWAFTSDTIHLPKKSPLISLHHNNWRQRAVVDSQNYFSDGIHYTVVQSISKSDYEKIKQILLNTIDQYAKVAGPSEEEELVCFACDFFRA